MKLATFEIPTTAGPLRRLGAAADGWIVDLAAGYAAYLDRTDPGCDAERLAALLLPADMTLFLGSGVLGRDAAERAIETAATTDDARGARTRYRVPVGGDDDEIRLLAPVARPRVLRDFLTFEGQIGRASCRERV